MKPRVRFAPSPTGYLHIGGARTALFNWLYARHTGGTFVLRIEDTDAARNSQEAVEVILNGLRWLGLDWDEGPIEVGSSRCDDRTPQRGVPTFENKGNFGPYFQSQRSEIYKRRVQELLSKGFAYEHEGAVKFRMTREPITIPDLVVGDVVRKLTDREEVDPDFVILRSDGQPVFHLVNVIDDLEMDITHVIRGEDHLSNTAKHIALFQAFGVKPPHFAHIPLILNGDGSKMSKRDTGASLTSYLDEGFLPEAVVNYLCLLGWSPKDNREKLSRAEVIERFDLPQILRHNARFDYEKLLWLQGEYARELADDRFYELAVHAFAKVGMDTNKFPLAYVKAALDTCKGKFKLFNELPGYAGFYFRDEIIYNADDAKKVFISENKPRLEKLRDAFAALNTFDAVTLETALKETAKQLGVKAGVLIHPTRLAVTGNPHGPSLYHLLEVLGKEKMLARIECGLKQMAPEYIKLADLPEYFNEELMKHFSYYSVALGRIRNRKAEGFTPLGSGVLIERKNRFGILTARHCLHACKPEVEIGPSGCDTLSLTINRGRSVLVKPNEAIEHKLVEPKTEEFGPDLVFIEVFGESLATLRAVGSFWPLDKKPDDVINQFGKVEMPIVSIGFPQVDYKTEILPEVNTINHRIRHMTFSNVIQNGDVYEHDGWDYLESNMWYGGTPDLPETFKGVSGGPVWGLQIKKDKDNGRFSIGKSALIGITFYQTPMKGDERRLRAHFIKSIYDLAWRNFD